MQTVITTWADAHGTWHVGVGVQRACLTNATIRKMAKLALVDEIRARETSPSTPNPRVGTLLLVESVQDEDRQTYHFKEGPL